MTRAAAWHRSRMRAATVVANTYGSDGRVLPRSTPGASRQPSPGTRSPRPRQSPTHGSITVDTHSGAALVSRRDGEGDLTSFAYDAAYNPTPVTVGRANAATMTYDGRGNVLRSRRRRRSYVQRSRTTSRTMSLKRTMKSHHDERVRHGRQPDETTYSDGPSTFDRDPAGTGLLVGVTDQRGKSTSFDYDADANLETITSPGGASTTMSYDAVGGMIERIEPRGNVGGATPSDYATVSGMTLRITSRRLPTRLTCERIRVRPRRNRTARPTRTTTRRRSGTTPPTISCRSRTRRTTSPPMATTMPATSSPGRTPMTTSRRQYDRRTGLRR
jgi:YD repeat-containing protein